jgi:uncharacterized membrane protein YfcA
MSDQFLLIGLVVVAYLAAGSVKGVIGMGLPTVAIAVLASIMSPAKAAAILIAPSLATNVWQMVAGPYLGAAVKRLGPMLIGIWLGAWAGAGILTGGNSRLAALGLGVVLIVYALIGLSRVQFSIPHRHEVWAGPLVGLVTGVILAATGIFVIPALPYMQAIGLEKDELVQALGLHFTNSTVVLAAVLWTGSAFDTQLALLSLLAIVPAVIGMVLGQRVRALVSVGTFRVCLFALLLILGGQLVARNLVW